MPSMDELMIKTGKTQKDITRALINLEDQLYIIWDNKKLVESIRILQGWEQREKPARPTSGNTDYWTQY